jgi:hypothetical protein
MFHYVVSCSVKVRWPEIKAGAWWYTGSYLCMFKITTNYWYICGSDLFSLTVHVLKSLMPINLSRWNKKLSFFVDSHIIHYPTPISLRGVLVH